MANVDIPGKRRHSTPSASPPEKTLALIEDDREKKAKARAKKRLKEERRAEVSWRFECVCALL
jgi:hypothetical protein